MSGAKKMKKYTRAQVVRNRAILVCVLAVFVIAVVVATVKLVSKKNDSKEVFASNDAVTTETQTTTAAQTETVEAGAITHVADGQEKGKGEYPGKTKVYLTFDDGTTEHTTELLDVLDKYGVKATFFLTCNSHDYDIENMKRIVESGHSIAIHSVTHVYSDIYSSLDAFKEDVVGMQQYLYDVTGYKTWLYRFPGGSNNTKHAVDIKECQKFLDDSGFLYYDWNVSSLDANGDQTSDQIFNNVMSGIDSSKEENIVLMHDKKNSRETLDAVPRIIEAIQAKGYMIVPITENTTPIHFK